MYFFCVSCGNFKNSLRFNLLNKETERLRWDKLQKYLQKHPPLFASGEAFPRKEQIAKLEAEERAEQERRKVRGHKPTEQIGLGDDQLKGVMLGFCIIDYFILSYVVFNSTNGAWVVWVGGLGF